MPLINCEIELDLSWSKQCIISEISITPRIPPNQDANPSVQEMAAIQTTGATFQIKNTKLYIPVVTLSMNDNIKFFKNIKQEFEYYMPLVKIKDFNELIKNKPFFDQLVKNKQEVYEKLIEMSRNDDYTAENLLYYLYNQKYYKIVGIDLSRQTNTSIPQQINFVAKLAEDDGATMFFVTEKQ